MSKVRTWSQIRAEEREATVEEQESQIRWDRRFVEMAQLVASWSKDMTKVGCVVVGPDKEVRSVGYNGFPRGVQETEEKTQRPEKYLWTEHAERNAIYNAARMGLSMADCTIYCSWVPCMDCARAIIQSGITTVVGKTQRDVSGNWDAQFVKVHSMFAEAGVEFRFNT